MTSNSTKSNLGGIIRLLAYKLQTAKTLRENIVFLIYELGNRAVQAKTEEKIITENIIRIHWLELAVYGLAKYCQSNTEYPDFRCSGC